MHATTWTNFASIVFMLLAFLSIGLPEGCNTTGNVGVDPDIVKQGSPAPADSSGSSPVVVLRDNPLLGGSFWASGTKAEGQGKCSSKKCPYELAVSGKWKNVRGWIELEHVAPDGPSLDSQVGSLLPMTRTKAPGFINWATRTFDLVHDNLYRATVAGQYVRSTDSKYGVALPNDISPPANIEPLWLRLSDDVALIPIVVINLRWRNDRTLDYAPIAKAMFDFVPYASPAFLPESYTLEDVKTPNSSVVKSLVSPDMKEVPPDDVLHQCNVQTQMLTSYVVELGDEWAPTCGTNGPSSRFGLSQDFYEDVIRSSGTLGAYIVDELKPIVVVYSNACSWIATPIGKQTYSRLVEVEYPLVDGDPITAHEIGHVLFGPQHVDAVNAAGQVDNLMATYPAWDRTVLSSEQCARGHAKAKEFSDRYRIFLRRWGRVIPTSLSPIDLYDGVSMADRLPDPANFVPVCCLVPRLAPGQQTAGSSYFTMTTYGDCKQRKGKLQKNTTKCSVCCRTPNGLDALTVPSNECGKDDEEAPGMCERVCCSTVGPDPYSMVSRYRCDATGGSVIECDAIVPQ